MIHPIRRILLFAIALMVMVPTASRAFQPQERFLGMVSDGARLKSDKVLNWFEQTSNPTLANHAIFDGQRPMRWIIDQAVPQGPEPEVLLRFFGGDQLPARVLEYVPPAPDSFENLGGCLLVKPTVSIDLPGHPPAEYIRVSMQWLKRIVFDARSGSPPRYQPGTVFLRNGGKVSYEVARWRRGTLSILTGDGVQSLSLGQIAEVHFPRRDMWEVWFEQLAALDPNLDQRLFQIESSSGVRLTASRQRLRPRYRGDHNKSENWYPEFHPAWSLDPLVLPFKTIRRWRFCSATEPPASLFDPVAERERAVFSAGWNWQRNRNVQRSDLINSALHFGWGFGVHAPTKLSLPLHPVVTHFRTRIGLDQSVMSGGCARGIVSFGSKTPVELRRTEVLIGNQSFHDTNWLSVPATNDGDSTLVLAADPVIDGRPANADSLDIRDCLNWLEPEWRLDKTKLQQEVSWRVQEVIPGLAGWSLHDRLYPKAMKPDHATPANASSARPSNPVIAGVVYLDETIAEDIRTRMVFCPTERFVVAKRRFSVGENARWFAVAVSRTKGSTPAWVQVRANGRAIGQGQITERNSRVDPEPVVVPVAHLVGQEVEFELVMMAEGDQSNLDFRGARVLESRPGLVRIFEDESNFAKKLRNGKGELSVTNKMAFTKSESLRLTGGDRVQAQIKGLNYAITENPRLGEYRFLRFAWKKEEGERIGLQLGFDGQIGPTRVIDDKQQRAWTRGRRRGPRERFVDDARGVRFGYQYDAGHGNPTEPVKRLAGKAPATWVLYSRDLFGEFGSFRLTGLGFLCPDGTAAYFDHLYLARTQNDFQYVSDTAATPTVDDKDVLVHATRQWEHQLQVQRVTPEFSLERSGEPVQLLAKYQGKRNVVRTSPVAQGQPAILRAPLSVPTGKKTILKIIAGRNVAAMADWQLIVKVGTEQLHQSMLDANSAQEGWAEFSIDLSKFAGKNIVVEVHNHPNNWHYEHAYWSELSLEFK